WAGGGEAGIGGRGRVAGGVEAGGGRRRAARGGPSLKRTRGEREKDYAVAVPGSADAVGVAKDQRRAAGDVEPLQFLVGKEADRAPVGRPEGQERTLRAGKHPRLRGRERPLPESDLPFDAGSEDDMASVRRQRWEDNHRRLLRREKSRAKRLRRLRSTAGRTRG